MFCPDCKKEVELSQGDPQLGRVRLDVHTLRADASITDLCGECYRPLAEVKLLLERGLQDVPALQAHLSHPWRAETVTSKRGQELPGQGIAKATFGVNCECGKMPLYEVTIIGTAPMVVLP